MVVAGNSREPGDLSEIVREVATQFRANRTDEGRDQLNSLLGDLDAASMDRVLSELAEAGPVYIGECKLDYPYADVYREITKSGARDRCRHRPPHTSGF